MANVALASPPLISSLTRPLGVLETHVTLPLQAFGPGRCLLFHPAAVVEEKGAGRSFWALVHPPGDPDFHDPACFTLQLPPPAQA